MKVLLAGAAVLMAGGVAFAQTPAPAPATPDAPKVRVMRAPMKTMTRDEAVSHVRDMFARLDTNRDGFVTREEAQAAHKKMAGEMRDKMRKRFAERRGETFDRLDTNHDGSISRQEFMAQSQAGGRRAFGMRDGAAGTPMRMHRVAMRMGFGGRMFDVADANHDGRVTLAEAQAAALAHFDRADLNHDGKITPEERQQAREQMRAQRRPS